MIAAVSLALALALTAPPAPAQAVPDRMVPLDTMPSVLHPTDGGLTADRVAQRALFDAPDVDLRAAELEAHIAVREQDLRLRHALGEIARPSEPARGDATG